MLLSIKNKDLTKYVQESAFVVDSEDVYEEWRDGNYAIHRMIIRQRVKGSFKVNLYGSNNMDSKSFLELWNSAVKNGVITLGVWVNNLNKFKNIEAYYTITTEKHVALANGGYLDVFVIKIEEK